jgi:hypothetical protein
MRRKITPAMFSLMLLILPFTLVSAQEKKNEQKIKVVIDDGSGKKVLIDTVFNNRISADSIVTKDGTVIFMKHPGDREFVMHHQGKDGDGKFEKFTVISSDSAAFKTEADGRNVYFYSNSGQGEGNGKTENRRYRVITSQSDNDGKDGETIYIKKGKASDMDGNRTFDVLVTDDYKDSKVEKSRIIIARDGMVVTIEGNDEKKTQELADRIKDQMGVDKKDASTKGSAGSESNNSTKK